MLELLRDVFQGTKIWKCEIREQAMNQEFFFKLFQKLGSVEQQEKKYFIGEA